MPCRGTPLALSLLLLLAPGLAGAGIYPTDQCVATKLEAAALYCRDAVRAEGRGHGGADADDRLVRARERLAEAWDEAEATSAEAGVSCEDTTASAEEIVALLDAGAAAIGDAIESSSGMPGARPDAARSERRCEASRTVLAAQACHHLLESQATHLLERSEDRDRRELAKRSAVVKRHLKKQWNAGTAAVCRGGPSGGEAVDLVGGVVDDVLHSTIVSPNVSTEWTVIDPDDQVPYAGETLAPGTVLDPICSYGTPWVFFVKRGTVNKTLMYYQGGGACWDQLTCSLPIHKTSVDPIRENPATYDSGFADLSNPDNPFRDWNMVFVPYCTGDVHWGDAVVDHVRGRQTTRVYHKGFVNAQVAEKWAREHFVNPDQVFVTGSSAGAYGAIVNSLPLQEYVWPSSDFAVLGDAGNGVITQDFLENDLVKWGIEKNLPEWIPGLNKPLTELSAADLWSETALFYPTHRFANYTTAFDGSQGGQTGFYNVMLNIDNILAWTNWWVPSCEWNAIMRQLVQDAAAEAPNYRYYIGTGSRHTMWGSNKVYTDTTGGVPTILDWVNAMLLGSVDWTNVECTDCGTLLPGDPRPNPPLEPYTAAGIVCDDAELPLRGSQPGASGVFLPQ